MADLDIVIREQAYERAFPIGQVYKLARRFHLMKAASRTHPLPVIPISAMTISSLLNLLIWAMPASVIVSVS
jgi:hypothetical protein